MDQALAQLLTLERGLLRRAAQTISSSSLGTQAFASWRRHPPTPMMAGHVIDLDHDFADRGDNIQRDLRSAGSSASAVRLRVRSQEPRAGGPDYRLPLVDIGQDRIRFVKKMLSNSPNLKNKVRPIASGRRHSAACGTQSSEVDRSAGSNTSLLENIRT
jgi:hypothetical protein